LRATARGNYYNGPTDYEIQSGYLSNADEEELATIVLTAESLKSPMTTAEVVEEAGELKSLRCHKGFVLLLVCDCTELANEVSHTEVDCPSPQWVKHFCERHSLHVKNCRGIDAARIRDVILISLMPFLKLMRNLLQGPLQSSFSGQMKTC
jgi:hypothetical protein